MNPWLPVALAMIFVISLAQLGLLPWWSADPALVVIGVCGGLVVGHRITRQRPLPRQRRWR